MPRDSSDDRSLEPPAPTGAGSGRPDGRAEQRPPTPENNRQSGDQPPTNEHHEEERPRSHRTRWIVIGVIAVILIVLGATIGRTWLIDYFTTESTDDAFVNSHISYISPRVAGNVIAVYVDDNDRVRQGDLLLEIDHEPYEIMVAQRRAALGGAEANLRAAVAEARAQEAAARANLYTLINTQEQVRYQVATLNSNVADLRVQEAQLALAHKETERAERLVKRQAATQEELDERRADEEVARQRVASAWDTIRRTRAALGLPPNDKNPAAVPSNLEQEFSGVQTALSNAARSLAQLGLKVPLEHLTAASLRKQLASLSPTGNLNQALDKLLEEAPQVQQATQARDQAREDLRNALLNLQYTYVYAAISGQVTGRSANPGYNVTAGQTLMAVRSLTEIWIDANFKETQLDYLRVGQPVNIHVDAYPDKTFHGRVEGFSAGTGSSLALIPPENATGNYVKIVQRLPVRISINREDLNPDTPLFIGLSVEPYVLFKEQPTGPDAGARLLTPIRPSAPRPPVPPPATGTGSHPHVEPPPPSPYRENGNTGSGAEARRP